MVVPRVRPVRAREQQRRSSEVTDDLLRDGLTLARLGRDGVVVDRAMVAEVLASFDREELMRLCIRLALVVDVAVNVRDWDEFERVLSLMVGGNG
jgi:hypothetical protein